MEKDSSQSSEQRQASVASKVYLARVNGIETGPYSLRELSRMRTSRELAPDTPCRLVDAKEWTTLDTLLLHKQGIRRLKKVRSRSFSAFSRRTLPSLVLIGIGLVSLAFGAFYAVGGASQMMLIGYMLVALGFVLCVLAYFIHPRSES